MKETADRIYSELEALGIEALLDDRDERAGVKFKDADLLGFPVRIVIGEKNLPNVELKLRSEKDVRLIPASDAAKETESIVKNALSALNAADNENI